LKLSDCVAMSLRIADCMSENISFIEPFGRKSNRLSTCAPSPRAVIVAAGDPQGHRQAVRELQALLRGRLNPGRLESII